RRGRWVWLEGVHLCQEYLRRVGPPLYGVFDARRVEGENSGRDSELQNLAGALAADQLIMLENDLLQGISEIAGMQGVGFVIEQPQVTMPQKIDHTCVVLDQIQDPGNVGSIIRTCAAAGVGSVVLIEGTASAWSGKVLRAAQGAHFAIQLYDQVATDEAARVIAVPLVATSLSQAQNLYDEILPAHCGWVFGHEGHGVSEFWLQRAARRVFIPQVARVESLNVAAGGAVCLFEQRRQLLMQST